jgi:ketosteroid isomerase-like protein
MSQRGADTREPRAGALVAMWLNAVNSGAWDELGELLAQDAHFYFRHDDGPPLVGGAAIVRSMREWRAQYRTLVGTTSNVLIDGERAAAEFRWEGLTEGGLAHRFSSSYFLRAVDGRIVEISDYYDRLSGDVPRVRVPDAKR